MIVSSPMDEQDLRDMMYTASEYNESAWAIRYPRGRSTGMQIREGFKLTEIGKGRMVREGEKIAVLSFGPIGKYVIDADKELIKEEIQIGHFDMRYAKPLDTVMIDYVLANYDHIITLEDGTRLGGFGSAVAEYVAEKGVAVPVKIMGVPDTIIEHGTQRELHDEVGIGPAGIIAEVKRALGVLVS
jgi:1-deoxy-D-xylulose-5-phosphate synthase